MPNQITVPPPPTHSPITQEEASVEWKNWFSTLYEILEAQNLVSKPPIPIGGGDQTTYWHKIFDPAWVHLAHTPNVAPIVATLNNPITNWESKVVEDWQLVSDLAAGTVVVDQAGYDETGYYHVSVTGFAEGSANTTYTIQMFADGVAGTMIVPIVLKGNTTTAGFAISGVIRIPNSVTLDIRLTQGASLTLHSLNWSMHRISPIVDP